MKMQFKQREHKNGGICYFYGKLDVQPYVHIWQFIENSKILYLTKAMILKITNSFQHIHMLVRYQQN